MTPLAALLAARIAATGPITLADYMAECLMHPEHGYYVTRDPFGATGDFITAPEISQMFGEMLGLCLAQVWLDQGAPAQVTLAELGPGRGTLMADMLRATRRVPGFHDAVQVHFVETSPLLQAAQAKAVPGAVWHDNVHNLPDAPLLLVANEFFDALPIRQFVRETTGWRERVAGVQDGALCAGLTDPAPLAWLDDRLADTRHGNIIEHCPALPAIVGTIAARVAGYGGTALIIDYGDWHTLGDTFQAMQEQQSVDPFATPGLADLTAHVDFEAISKAAGPARYTRLTSQGVFLERLGITARAQMLAKELNDAALESHIAAHRRLTHPAEMGDLFKVMALYPANAAPPPGLNA